ncbi:tail assembly chaperone [Pseudomonas phage Epa7]|uniref:Tail assembly protein n=24 Tax=Pbunavirus TaxID=1198980 RepID=A0A7D4XQ16_9CAUD|nr:hypothetical protein [Staphylococcus aureus]YP_007238216.1 tail assembly chaperone [Pseudomonas phage KPP12]YP_009124384.1 tail assembly chaperone [Pseudomonas phage vB_PaeM_PAO1_Ab27]YP_009593815.1 tail assembly chaperone [Pseudomonas phage vB_PaeM_CEB_DP1]YP_009597886.1 tail assembly chaperone [Pseudomonas phage PA5]YP_009619415.1 tail assembly chaperone [Pseudomonas phage vB_PaeM_E217]YP_009829628.1 tail assembly chaperone [Pseudomonas phage PA01]YP_009837417.1 tail assembly chaperone 
MGRIVNIKAVISRTTERDSMGSPYIHESYRTFSFSASTALVAAIDWVKGQCPEIVDMLIYEPETVAAQQERY